MPFLVAIFVISSLSWFFINWLTESFAFNDVHHTYSEINHHIFTRSIDTPSVMELINNEKWRVIAIQQKQITYYDGNRLHTLSINKEQQESLFKERAYMIHSSNDECENIDINLPPFVYTPDKETEEMIENSHYCLFTNPLFVQGDIGLVGDDKLKITISEIRGDMVKSLPIAKEIVSEHYASINETHKEDL